MRVALVVVAMLAVVTTITRLVLWVRLKRQLPELERALEHSGEELLLGPEVCLYLGTIHGIMSAKTHGLLALTDQRLVLRSLIGSDTGIPLSQVAAICESKWFAGNYRGGRKFVILRLADGTARAFQVKGHDVWMRRLTSVSVGIQN